MNALVAELLKANSPAVDRFMNPRIPIVLDRPSGSHPSFCLQCPGSPAPFLYDPPPSDRGSDRIVIVTFASPNLERPQGWLTVDGKNAAVHRFGEADGLFFILGRGDQIASARIIAHWTNIKAAWIIVQSLVKKSPSAIIGDICRKTDLYQAPDSVFRLDGWGLECQGCKFDVISWFDKVQDTGDAYCENCKKPVVLLTMSLSLEAKAVPDEDVEATKQAKNKFYELFYVSSCFPKLEPDWDRVIFGNEEEEEAVAELDYKNSEEFLGALAQFRTDVLTDCKQKEV
jgi:hypothetical protein